MLNRTKELKDKTSGSKRKTQIIADLFGKGHEGKNMKTQKKKEKCNDIRGGERRKQ